MVPLPPPDETWSLNTHLLGHRVHVYHCVDSTNSIGLALAQDARNDGLVVLAHEQTGGRGQYGRSWTAPPRSSVLLSVLLFPPPHLRRPAVLTSWAAVSVCALLQQQFNLQARIKWPNDVLLQGQKVCGILIEQRADGQGNLATVVGIGLNVNQSADFFRQANLPQATSLAIATGQERNTDEVARLLVQELDEQYLQLCQGDVATLEACWKWRLGLLGRPVIVETLDKTYQGRLREVTFASVEVELEGEILSLVPEAIRHLT